ncbi:MAG: FUSC family protein [Verrucomicrobia bacterium]|nr:FUSC family protein [Verrucomicrobiota bacterium]
MSATTRASNLRGEHRLWTLLRHELAPGPARWRAALRLTGLCILGTAVISAWQLSGGQFLVLMFFMVAMSDAPTSRATVGSNMLGSLAGGMAGVAVLAVTADSPWILFPLEAVVITLSLYAMRRTTRPLAFLFFAVSFVVVVPEFLPGTAEAFYSGMAATAYMTAGIGLGTLGQILWWPENPTLLLMDDLAESLRAVAQHCRGLLAEEAPTADEGPAPRSLGDSAARLFRQLDLLREAEAGDPWLRQRHTEQVQLITEIQRLVFLTQLLGPILNKAAADPEMTTILRGQIRSLAGSATRWVESIRTRVPPPPWTRPASSDTPPPYRDILEDLAEVMEALPAALVCVTTLHETGRVPPTREPVATVPLVIAGTPETRRQAMQYGLKAAFAASLCGLIYQGLGWPGIGTCVVTTVLVAQATVGLGRHKSLLRFSGALLAGLAVLLLVGVAMPNMESLASLLVTLGAITFVAAWIASGSSRLSYLGVQMGVTLYLVLFPRLGPNLDLVPARDRLIGILLGIAVMGVVDAILWPVFTRASLREKVADLLRQLAGMHRELLNGTPDGASARALGIHRGFGEALTLQEELVFETLPGDESSGPERQRVLRILSRLQSVFLALLSLQRERTAGRAEVSGTGPADDLTTRLESLARVAAAGQAPAGRLAAFERCPRTMSLVGNGPEARLQRTIAALEYEMESGVCSLHFADASGDSG